MIETFIFGSIKIGVAVAPNEKFGLLRSILKTLGLSAEATDDIVDRISDFSLKKSLKPLLLFFLTTCATILFPKPSTAFTWS